MALPYISFVKFCGWVGFCDCAVALSGLLFWLICGGGGGGDFGLLGVKRDLVKSFSERYSKPSLLKVKRAGIFTRESSLNFD